MMKCELLYASFELETSFLLYLYCTGFSNDVTKQEQLLTLKPPTCSSWSLLGSTSNTACCTQSLNQLESFKTSK